MPRRVRFFLSMFFVLATLPLALSDAHAQFTHIGPAGAIALAKTVPPYEVSSIRQNKSADSSSGIHFEGNTLAATNVTVQFLLQFAYGVKANQISGLAGPVASMHFDITAKVLPSADGTMRKLTGQQLVAMIIPLLAERFDLQAHLESRVSPVYDLVVAKPGIKLKLDQSDRTDASTNSSFEGSKKVLTTQSSSLTEFADALSDVVDRKVIDKTGLPGYADITLKWSDDMSAEQGDANTISIFTAIQEQLGLKLQPSKGPVDTLVIDHVEMPTQN